MAIIFIVRYHPRVVTDDMPLLSSTWKERVRYAIEEKLTSAPEVYGKPLRQSLRGYRKLRVGDYRVVFRIEHEHILVLAILHRSVVYKKTAERLH